MIFLMTRFIKICWFSFCWSAIIQYLCSGKNEWPCRTLVISIIIHEHVRDKTNSFTLRPAIWHVTQVCPVWLVPSMGTWRNFRYSATYWMHSQDSDQPGLSPGWSEFLLGTKPKSFFCHAQAYVYQNYSLALHGRAQKCRGVLESLSEGKTDNDWCL